MSYGDGLQVIQPDPKAAAVVLFTDAPFTPLTFYHSFPITVLEWGVLIVGAVLTNYSTDPVVALVHEATDLTLTDIAVMTIGGGAALGLKRGDDFKEAVTPLLVDTDIKTYDRMIARGRKLPFRSLGGAVYFEHRVSGVGGTNGSYTPYFLIRVDGHSDRRTTKSVVVPD